MARPRIFVSSTFYDLKHIRASLEVFIESLGYDAILFEKGDISFHPDVPLDESCYREAANADMFVLIIGGRYGSATSESAKDIDSRVQIYESITKKEFETAQSGDVPTFILLDSAVSAEYQTYLRNRKNESIVYAHVDSIGVFKLLDAVFERSKNNPVFNFDRATQIEAWLREQWAGLFRELLNSRSQQRQLTALSSQVSELKTVNHTLKTYLEEVLTKVTPKNANRIIQDEEEKIVKARVTAELARNTYYDFLTRLLDVDPEEAKKSITDPDNADQAILVADRFGGLRDKNEKTPLRTAKKAQDDFNAARKLLIGSTIDFQSSSFADVVLTAFEHSAHDDEDMLARRDIVARRRRRRPASSDQKSLSDENRREISGHGSNEGED